MLCSANVAGIWDRSSSTTEYIWAHIIDAERPTSIQSKSLCKRYGKSRSPENVLDINKHHAQCATAR